MGAASAAFWVGLRRCGCGHAALWARGQALRSLASPLTLRSARRRPAAPPPFRAAACARAPPRAAPVDGAKVREYVDGMMSKRIMIIDGAMGTTIQQYKFTEADFRGERFKDFTHDIRGNNDMLVLTQPDTIYDIHRRYFEAGADICETNTFSGTTIAQADYGMEDIVYGARAARGGE